MTDLNTFRQETRDWLQANCPASIRGRSDLGFAGGDKVPLPGPDEQAWFDACRERGYTVPTWPTAYGGGGLGADEARVLRQEMGAIGAPNPLGGMGVTMIGPTLLEHGTEAQKQQHLTAIATGQYRWCQGYSEPGAGSDLAALQTRAVDEGDYFVINGQKIWTSGAQYADWIFCLVRTDPDASKHEGISFVLFPMSDPGVSVKPIQLIAGNSPFCECFFDDVKALKTDLVGQLNRGWTIGKRLLQHERSMISGADGGGGPAPETLADLGRRYQGADIAPAERDEHSGIMMDERAFSLTTRRAREENTAGGTPTFATSMFKYYATELLCRQHEANVRVRGTQGLGWEGDTFTGDEIDITRTWLNGKAYTIAGGSSEVQLNIVAKRVLGLPD